jgi:outer membrane protein TolC
MWFRCVGAGCLVAASYVAAGVQERVPPPPDAAQAAEVVVIEDAVPGADQADPAGDAGDAGAQPYFSSIIPQVLDLDAAQRVAIEQNPTLDAAFARVQQAEERVRQARSLYFPTVSASWQAFRTELSDNTIEQARAAVFRQSFLGLQSQIQGVFFGAPAPTPSALGRQVVPSTVTGLAARAEIDDTITNYQASLVLSWTVFDGFNRKFTHAIARFGARETEAAYAESHRLLLAAVAAHYYQVQLAREILEIAHADEAFNLRQLHEAEARYRIGTGSRSNQLNFEVRVRAARAAVLDAERAYEIARIGLAALMGIPEATIPRSVEIAELHSERPEEMHVPDDDALLAYAKEFRPDLNQGRYAVARAESTIGQRRAPFYPSVRAIASRDADRGDTGRFEIDDDFSTTIGVRVDYELFAGGRNRAALREAKYAQREAEYRLHSLAIEVAADVRVALQELATAQQQLLLQRATAEFVRQNRELVEREYAAGQGSLVRLNEAQRDLIEAQSRLAAARVALRLAWHDLRTATGETLRNYNLGISY